MTHRLACAVFVAACLPLPALSGTCPAAPDHGARLDALFQQVRAAPNEGAAAPIVNRMWELWADAPDERAREILERGMRKRASHNLLGALRDFDRLIGYCPDWAEGYNQRGFVLFIQQDYVAALPDLDRALALSPRHVGALSGRALTHMALGNAVLALTDLEAALTLNPWLSERRFLAPLRDAAGSEL